MSDRARILALAALVATGLCAGGCGADDSGTNPVGLELVVPGGSQVDVGATVTVEARVSSAVGLLVSYDWTVTDPQKTPVSTGGGSKGKTITFVAAEAGSYTVACAAQVEGYGRFTKSIPIESGTAGAQLTYRARVTPPPGSGVPPFDENVTIADGVALTHDFSAADPRQVSLKVSYNGAALPTHVSAMLSPDDPRPQRLYLATGQGTLSLASGATLVLMPEDPAPGGGIAPLARGVSASSSAIDVELDGAMAGLLIEGKVERAAGAALDGATVTLRTVDVSSGVTLPSTVATTDSQGRYQLRARPGKARLLVLPPANTALPIAEVADQLSLSAAESGWTFRYKAAASAELGGKVVDADGQALVGATVVLSTESLPDVGELELPGGQKLSASGRYRVELTTDVSGALLAAGKPLITVPKGTYRVEILPPPGASAGITQRDLIVASSQTLSLAAKRKAAVRGVVRGVDGETVAARVELRGPHGAVAGLARAEEGFELAVDRGFVYTLAVRPLDASLGAPLWQTALMVDGDKSLDGLKLPRATLLSGALREGSGAAIPGALIQLYCEQPSCARKGLIDETRTDAAGRYLLRVPQSGGSGSAP